MPHVPKNFRDFESLRQIVADLRGPDGCPWDKEQTHQTLTRYAIEEIFELVETLDQADYPRMKDELGDVLFQVLLHAQLASEEKKFDVMDVVENLGQKMVRRHPHVFGDVKVSDSNEVLKNWAEIKAEENAGKPQKPLFDYPEKMPALVGAMKIGEKTSKIKFDWDHWQDVLAKVDEEVLEMKNELEDSYSSMKSEAGRKALEHEIGDVLFSVAQLARHCGIDPEQALRKTNARFVKRFDKMQAHVKSAGLNWDEISLEEKEKFWQRAKKG